MGLKDLGKALFGGLKKNEASNEVKPVQQEVNPTVEVQDTMQENLENGNKIKTAIEQLRFTLGNRAESCPLNAEQREKIDQVLMGIQNELDKPVDVMLDVRELDVSVEGLVNVLDGVVEVYTAADWQRVLDKIYTVVHDKRRSSLKKDVQHGALQMEVFKVELQENTTKKYIETLENQKRKIDAEIDRLLQARTPAPELVSERKILEMDCLTQQDAIKQYQQLKTILLNKIERLENLPLDVSLEVLSKMVEDINNEQRESITRLSSQVRGCYDHAVKEMERIKIWKAEIDDIRAIMTPEMQDEMQRAVNKGMVEQEDKQQEVAAQTETAEETVGAEALLENE